MRQAFALRFVLVTLQRFKAILSQIFYSLYYRPFHTPLQELLDDLFLQVSLSANNPILLLYTEHNRESMSSSVQSLDTFGLFTDGKDGLQLIRKMMTRYKRIPDTCTLKNACNYSI